MNSVPKIVQERLKAGAPAGAHPDADLLTAYAEKSLTQTERSGVLEHLARCGSCRDVVALALPEAEAQTVVAPVRGAWFTWPALRWGLAAAGVVAFVSVGVVQYQRRAGQTATVAKATPASVAVTPSAETQPSSPAAAAPAIANPATAKSNREQPREDADNTRAAAPLASPMLPARKEEAAVTTNQKKVMAQAQAPRASRSGGVGSGFTSARVGGPNMPSQWQQQQQAGQMQTSQVQMPAAAPALTTPSAKQQAAGVAASNGAGAQPPAPPTQQEVVEVQTANAQLQTQTQDVGNQISTDRYSLSKAKPATSAQAGPAPVPLNPAYSANTMVMVNALPSPRWTISASGGLQRSFDQGSSWQDVNVTASAAPAKVASAATADAAFANKNYANAPALKALPAPPVFRAVSANGADVWAGGNRGILYHSADAGSHWSRVLPAPGIAHVGGDIVAVAFSDSQRGQISTSTGESWTTSDGGQSWNKQ